MYTQINSTATASGVDVVDVSSADFVPANPTRGLMVGATGDVAIVGLDGSSATLPALVAGAFYPIGVVKVLKTGTTATSIVLLR